jgi:DNA-directed RNA polymerase subunit RPC12/RpoP
MILKTKEAQMTEREKIEYQVDFQTGEYVCGKCKKRFPVAYYRKKLTGRTMTSRIMYAPKANFIRHLKACYKELEEMKW